MKTNTTPRNKSERKYINEKCKWKRDLMKRMKGILVSGKLSELVKVDTVF